MTYLPSHRYEPDGAGVCRAPTPDGHPAQRCYRPDQHPIHRTDLPLYEAVALALAEHQWRTGADRLAANTEHHRHDYHYQCALCTSDVHAIAAFVVELFLPGHKDLPRGDRAVDLRAPNHPWAPPAETRIPPTRVLPPKQNYIHWATPDTSERWAMRAALADAVGQRLPREDPPACTHDRHQLPATRRSADGSHEDLTET